MNNPPRENLNHSQASAKKLRSELRAKRGSLSSSFQSRASYAASRQLLKRGSRSAGAIRRAKSAAIYLPAFGEISPLPLLLPLSKRGMAIYVPVTFGVRMRFTKLSVSAIKRLRLRRHPLGMPAVAGRGSRSVGQVDLVVVPLVAFDSSGNRLGMGGGFYDRALAGAKRTLKLGYAYDFQQVSALRVNPWDVKIDGVVTQNTMTTFRGFARLCRQMSIINN